VDVLVAERLTAQRLGAAAVKAEPIEAVRSLLAVQAQDGRGFRLALRARVTPAPSGAAVEELLGSGAAVVSWLCRGTLHLVCAEDYWWLQALTTPPLETSCLRRLEQEGVSPELADRAVDAIDAALAADGPSTRAQLATVAEQTGVEVVGQALIHILFLAALKGVLVRGPMLGKQHAYVLVRDWLGSGPPEPGRFDRDGALRELALRYLVGHAPATDRDLARWSGLPLRDARAGLAALGSAVAEGPDGRVRLLRSPAPGPASIPPPVLLGPWDPILVGWTDRSWVVGEHDARIISGGLFRSFALVGGKVVAVWKLRNGRVELEPTFVPLSAGERAALEADAAAVERFLAA
jgi:hypothetical protein